MKTSTKVWLVILVVIILVPVIFFALAGYIPGLSALFGTTKPRDLGVTYTEEDKNSAIKKSGATYGELPSSTADNSSIQFVGSHEINTSWSSAEVTALLNQRPWKYWPISKVQLRINQDNTVEMSGVVNAEKLRGYGAGIGVPSVVVDRVSLLPSEAAFYLKGSGSLTENKVSSFDISSAQLGRLTIPTSVLLSYQGIIDRAYAEDVVSELSKYSGKKGYVVDFINEKLAWVRGFFAKRAEFKNGTLEFEGSVPDEELTAR